MSACLERLVVEEINLFTAVEWGFFSYDCRCPLASHCLSIFCTALLLTALLHTLSRDAVHACAPEAGCFSWERAACQRCS